MKALGLFGLTIPEEYGGLGLTMEEEVHVMLAMGQTSPCLPLAVRHHGGHRLAGHPVRRHRGAEGRSYLPRLASGE
jgi:acyl-CoA dehydrogenase